jgi:hypothetical protein
MFSVLDKVKKRTRREVLNILLIQHGYDDYCQYFADLDNVNVYLYDSSNWSIPPENTPSNFLCIQDHIPPIVGCFDKIICIGKADEGNMAQQIQQRFGLDLILLNNSSEETYCPRPFTFKVREKTQLSANIEVSMSKHFGYAGMTTILPVEVSEPVSKKEDSVVVFNKIPSGLMRSFAASCQGAQLVDFTTDNLSSSKVFLDTIVGLTPHLLQAMSHGCIPIVPYSSEVEKLLQGSGYIYHGYEEIGSLVHKALASETSQHEIREISGGCYTNKKDFINKWNHILGRSV